MNTKLVFWVWVIIFFNTTQGFTGQVLNNDEISPYILYGKQLCFFQDCPPFLDKFSANCEEYYINCAHKAKNYILTKAKNKYQSKYGYLTTPLIDKENINNYKKKLKEGDLSVLLELLRVYENPSFAEYDPEQTEARQLLLTAVKHGSELAMMELEYDEPYISETSLIAGGKPITIQAVCRELKKVAGPSCFLYVLTIGETKIITDRKDKHYDQYRPPFLILDKKFPCPDSFRPQYIGTVKAQESTLIELVSFSNSNLAEIRKDYFNLAGEYLGSNASKFTPSFFHNFKFATQNWPSLKFKSDVIAQNSQQINLYPNFISFSVREQIRQMDLHALDDIHYGHRNAPYDFKFASHLDTEEKQQKAVDNYFLRFGYHPSLSRNLIRNNNIEQYMDEKGMPKDVFGARLLCEYYLNPTNEDYNPDTANKLSSSFELGWPWGENNHIQTFYNPLSRPYVTKTDFWIGQTEISALNVCQGARKEIQEKENNHCFAQQIRFRRGGFINYFHVVESFSSSAIWSGINWTKLQIQKTLENMEVIVNTNYHQGSSWDAWRKDFFDFSGQYLGSYNSDLSSIVLPIFKPINFPIKVDYLGTTPRIFLAVTPNWEDRQIINELAKLKRLDKPVQFLNKVKED